jgi:peptide/nickel transport system ATP-binding protein
MEKILEVKNISKIYSVGSLFSRIRITAVDNVSFYIKPAEIFTLAGESGCGKTTLSKIILGFEELNYGEILMRVNQQKISIE